MNKIQREALKARVAAQKATSFIQLAPEQPQDAPRMPQDASGAEEPILAYTCGHTVPLKKLAARRCSKCWAKHQNRFQLGRLPVGSWHHSTYLAENLWESTLTVPQGMGKMEIFVARASGLHAAEHAAFQKYRESLEGKE